MQNNQIICDHCGDVLYGKVGTAYVNKDYIQVRGRMVFEKFNKESMRYDYTFITPSEHEDLTFCVKKLKGGAMDFVCFEDYIEHRVSTGNGREGAEDSRRVSSLAPLKRPKNMPPFKL